MTKKEADDIVVLRDFVALEKVEMQPKTSSIIVQIKFDERIQTGIVRKVGSGVLAPNGEKHPVEVSVGDLVAFDRMNAREIVTQQGNKYLVINELSIMAILP